MTRKMYVAPRPMCIETFARLMAEEAPEWTVHRTSRGGTQFTFTDGKNWVQVDEVDEYVYVTPYDGSTADELAEAMDLLECDKGVTS